MTLTVLEHPLSPYAQKVKLALLYKGLEFGVEQPIGLEDAEAFAAASPSTTACTYSRHCRA